MAIVKTYISNQGEVFEGTRAQLMETMGIKQHNGLNRPSGALDADGDRWLEEVKVEASGFAKPQLRLFPGMNYDRRFATNKETGEVTDWVEQSSQACSETADIYSIYRETLESDPEHPLADEMHKGMVSIDSTYEVIGDAPETFKGNPAHLRATQEIRRCQAVLDRLTPPNEREVALTMKEMKKAYDILDGTPLVKWDDKMLSKLNRFAAEQAGIQAQMDALT